MVTTKAVRMDYNGAAKWDPRKAPLKVDTKGKTTADLWGNLKGA